MRAARSGNPAGGEQVVALGRLALIGLLAGVAAAVANAVVYLLASALGAIPASVEIPNTGGPLPLEAVVGFSFVPALLAAALLALLERFTRRPIRTFTIVAVVVFVLSLYTPFTVPGAPLSMILALELMHLIAAVVIVCLLTTRGRRA